MEFFCVYVRTRKKLDKYMKSNKIKNKYIVDIKKIYEEDISTENSTFENAKPFLKILIHKKIQEAIEKNKDVYYVPDFEQDFSIEKLLNIRKLLGVTNNFNILVFYNDFRKDKQILDDVNENLTKFSNSLIIKDF
jgi:hypothetical protein